MNKIYLVIVVGLLLTAVVGCRSDGTPAGSNVPTVEAFGGEATSPAPAAPTIELEGEAPVATGPGECRVVQPIGNLVPDLPEVTTNDWVRGRANAPVTLIEYADFECPGCARFDPTLAALVEMLGDDVRFVYRHFPLSFHERAIITAEAAEAAGAQGAFWEMHDLLYERQQEWVQVPAAQMPAVLIGYAEELRLDVNRFTADLQDHVYQDRVIAQGRDAQAMQLPGTPTFIVNGRLFPFEWGLSAEALHFFIQMALLEPYRYDEAPPTVIDPHARYLATIRTARGDIVIELYAETAPANVNSFVFLARDGWYDGVTFHRVISGFVAQAGDPSGTGAGNPGYQCDDEIDPRQTYDGPGVVGVANAGPNTGSSQFFIAMDALPQLNDGYTIIGRVIEGMDVVLSITPRDPQDAMAPPGDVIETILIEER